MNAADFMSLETLKLHNGVVSDQFLEFDCIAPDDAGVDGYFIISAGLKHALPERAPQNLKAELVPGYG